MIPIAFRRARLVPLAEGWYDEPMRKAVLLGLFVVGCASTPSGIETQEPCPRDPSGALRRRAIDLPGASGPLSLDYLAVDRARGRVWVPAAGTGRVDVIDAASGALSEVSGFATIEREGRGGKRLVGPSSATVAGDFVYVGNRADSAICAIDATTLSRGPCIALPTSPDGVQWIATTRELWVTTPKDRSLTVIDAKSATALTVSGRIPVEGEPEGYAVDEPRGVFFTNLEDRDMTLVIDVRERRVVSSWPAGCGAEGPRGLAYDAATRRLFVACTDHVSVRDAARGGAELGAISTGGGVDNIDWNPTTRLLYAAAGKAAMLTVAHVSEAGVPTVVARAPTAQGARVVVVDAEGRAFVADPLGGRVLELSAP